VAVLKSFACPACGAPITITGDSPEEKCAFCGNTVIVPPEMLHKKPDLLLSPEEIDGDQVQEGEIPKEEEAQWRAEEAQWQAEDAEQKATVEALRRARIQARQQHGQHHFGIRANLEAWHKNGYLSDAEFESAKKMFHIH